MKPLLLTLLALGAAAAPCSAQTAEAPAAPTVTLADLRTPTSPAFTLLGIAPTDIERPTTPRAFAVSLLSALRDGDGSLLPRDFALEVAPYWLVQRPKLSFKEYSDPTSLQSLKQTFSLSVAATKGSKEEIALVGDATNIGIGVRASPVAGHAPAKLVELTKGLRLAQTRALVIGELLDASANPTAPVPAAIRTELDDLARAEVDDPVAYKKMLKEIETILVAALAADSPDAKARVALQKMAVDANARMSKVALEIQAANQQRVGWVVDVAGGFVVRSLTVDTSNTEVTRGGLWASTGYSGTNTHGMFLVRLLKNRADPTQAETTIDAGGKISHRIDQLTLSGELLWRFDQSEVKRSSTTERAVVNIEYRVTEDVAITSTFGRDYGNTTLGLDGTTIAILGVNIGLGKLPKLLLPTK